MLKGTNPKLYWKLLNPSRKKATKCKVPVEELFEHFRNLNQGTDERHDTTDYGDAFVNNSNVLLNGPFTEAEICKVLNQVKTNKAFGTDCISNEYIKSTSTLMLPIYVKLFNVILETGVFPRQWSVGKIIPIYKNKGSLEDPNNYRGITVLSCLGKTFTGVLQQIGRHPR